MEIFLNRDVAIADCSLTHGVNMKTICKAIMA